MTGAIPITATFVLSSLLFTGITTYYKQKYNKSSIPRMYPILSLDTEVSHLKSLKIIYKDSKFLVIEADKLVGIVSSNDTLKNVLFFVDPSSGRIQWTIKRSMASFPFKSQSFAVSNNEQAQIIKFNDTKSSFHIQSGADTSLKIKYAWLQSPRYLEKIDSSYVNQEKQPVHKRVALAINMNENSHQCFRYQVIYNYKEISLQELSVSVILCLLHQWKNDKRGSLDIIEKTKLWNARKSGEILRLVENPEGYFASESNLHFQSEPRVTTLGRPGTRKNRDRREDGK